MKAVASIVLTDLAFGGWVSDIAGWLVTASNLDRLGSAIYTTFNHSDASPRYRIGFPLDVRFHFTDGGSHGSFCEMASLLGERIGLVDCFDHSKLGAESLFYLPRHPSELATEARVVIVPGLALSLEWLLQIVRDRLNERESIKIKEAQRAVDETIQTAELHQKNKTGSGLISRLVAPQFGGGNYDMASKA